MMLSSYKLIDYKVFHGNAVLWKVMEKSAEKMRIFPQLTTIPGKVGKSIRLFHISTKLIASDY
jgi:hypothetical protein